MCFCIVPGNDAEVCQIAAIEGLDEFNVYAIPQHGISPGASAVNKLSVKHGVLFHDGQPVIAVRKSEALAQFLNWLKLKMPCVLLAHNAKAFDAKHLIKAVVSCDRMEEFNQMVLGFSDTLMAFRELFPDRKSCSQENLAKDLLGATYNAHNALHDVQMLQTLVSNFISNKLVLEHSFTLSWFQEYYIFLDQKNINLRTLQPLILSKAMSKGMADKVAASGLSIDHMLMAFQRGGKDCLSNVLMEMFRGKPRVTINKRVIAQICNFFQS